MVNTFITSSNFKDCAKNLDNRRLGKQRVEAYQILCICQDLKVIAKKLFSDKEFPKADSDTKEKLIKKREEWIKIIYSSYKEWCKENGKMFYFCKKQEKYFITSKELDRSDKEKRICLKSFVNHPVVKMWIGYGEALKQYINCCIFEWVRRGFVNNMKIYNISKDFEKPFWINSVYLINSHKASLLRKEKERDEKRWYWNKEDFKTVSFTEFYKLGYLWINVLSEENLLLLLHNKEKNIDMKTIMKPYEKNDLNK